MVYGIFHQVQASSNLILLREMQDDCAYEPGTDKTNIGFKSAKVLLECLHGCTYNIDVEKTDKRTLTESCDDHMDQNGVSARSTFLVDLDHLFFPLKLLFLILKHRVFLLHFE